MKIFLMRFSSSELSSHLLAFSVSFIAKNWRKYPYGSKRVKTSVLNFLAKICGAILQLLGRENSPGEKIYFFQNWPEFWFLRTRDESSRSLKIPSGFLIVARRKNPQGPVACLWKQKSSDNLTIFFISAKWQMSGV